MKKIKNLLKKIDDNCNNIIELNKKINKIEIDFNNINEKCDILTKKAELLESEMSNFNNNFNLMLNFIKEQNKYSNLEMLTLDNNVKKKRVLLMGFYGAPNLGDELMLEVIVSKLKKINNIDLTVMLSENREFDITNYPSLKIIHYPKSILDINILANYFDTVIVGGGALLDDSDYDYYNNQLTLSNSLINICYRMIQFNKQTILYGLSTSNTFSNEEYLAKLDYIFKNCTYISLRDTNSLEVLKKYKIDVSRVKIVDDLVFCCKENKNYVKKKSNFITIGIDFICKYENYDMLKNCVNWLCDYLYDNNVKYKILLIPFYEYQKNDSLFYNKLKNELKNDNVFILDYLCKFENIKKEFSTIDYMINMRYHGSILAYLFSIPSLNIIFDVHNHYLNKMNYLFNNYNFNTCKINFSQLNKNDFLRLLNELFNKISVSFDQNITKRANNQLNSILGEVYNEKK